jgi:hypothetical protein
LLNVEKLRKDGRDADQLMPMRVEILQRDPFYVVGANGSALLLLKRCPFDEVGSALSKTGHDIVNPEPEEVAKFVRSHILKEMDTDRLSVLAE